MIKLTKSNEPEILHINCENWTRTFLEKIAKGEKPTVAEETRYRHADIKEAIVNETNGKCAYCESKLRHIHHGDIEHIYPKSLDPALRFRWSNLTLACEICNQNKSNKDPILQHIIDPYTTNPEEHLIFIGSMIFHRGTPPGVNTITLLDLNRATLVERRQEKINQVMASFSIVFQSNLPDITKKDIIKNIKNNEASNAAPYTAMVCALLEQLKAKLPDTLSASL